MTEEMKAILLNGKSRLLELQEKEKEERLKREKQKEEIADRLILFIVKQSEKLAKDILESFVECRLLTNRETYSQSYQIDTIASYSDSFFGDPKNDYNYTTSLKMALNKIDANPNWSVELSLTEDMLIALLKYCGLRHISFVFYDNKRYYVDVDLVQGHFFECNIWKHKSRNEFIVFKKDFDEILMNADDENKLTLK